MKGGFIFISVCNLMVYLSLRFKHGLALYSTGYILDIWSQPCLYQVTGAMGYQIPILVDKVREKKTSPILVH